MSKNVLVLIDIQKEYTIEGCSFYLEGIAPSLSNCRILLTYARAHGWEIIHVQHSNGDKAMRFNPTTPYFEFVEGFEPAEGEAHYIKQDYSCYSNEAFSEHLQRLYEAPSGIPNVYLIGYNTVMCCLSTLEEARRKRHSMIIVQDATLAKAIGVLDERSTHELMLNVYREKKLATLVNTEAIVNELFK